MSKDRSQTDFQYEIESGFRIVAGCDEAGRGPLCGPVIAAAVIFRGDSYPLIADSKKMSARQRETAFDWIMQNCIVGIGQCSPSEIDELNILRASMLAMKRAILALSVRPEFVLVDGNRMPDGIRGRAIVRGDSKSMSIAAASIVAKVTRDRIMTDLATAFPQYGWDKNAGYPTAFHLRAIDEYGITDHHRRSFGPCKSKQ